MERLTRAPERSPSASLPERSRPSWLTRFTDTVRGSIGKVLMGVSLMAATPGCVSMHRPDYTQTYRASAVGLSETERDSREFRMRVFMSAPDEKIDKNPAWKSGIAECQIDRILENCEFLLKEATEDDFQAFLDLCFRARNTLGMINVDRHSAGMIRESLRNYKDPEHRRDDPVVLVIMSRDDHEGIAGIQALNVESHRIEELSKGYKVIIVETSSMTEIRHHLAVLEERGILREGNLHGVIVGSHGDQESVEAGIDQENVHLLARMNRFFNAQEAHLIYASCNAGEGEETASNLANDTGLVLPRTLVSSCSGFMVGIDFGLNQRGRFVMDSLRMQSFRDMMTLGLFNDTYQVSRSEIIGETLDRLAEEHKKIPKPFIRQYLAANVVCGGCISQLHERQKDGRPFLRPHDFRRVMESFADNGDLWEVVDAQIPVDRIVAYRDLQFRRPYEMKALHRLNVRPEDIEALRSTVRERGLKAQLSSNKSIMSALGVGISPQQLIANYRAGITEITAITLLRNCGLEPAHYTVVSSNPHHQLHHLFRKSK